MRVDSKLVSVRRPRGGAWPGRLAMLVLWLGGAAIFGGAGHLDGATVGCWTPLGLMVGTSILLALRHGMPSPAASRRLCPGQRDPSRDGVIEVEIRGRRHGFPVEDVVSGWTESESTQGVESVVLLMMRDGTEVRLACAGHRVAEGVLRAAGVAPDQRAVKIRVRPAPVGGEAGLLAIFVTFLAAALVALFGSW